jgi:hypothetical protein
MAKFLPSGSDIAKQVVIMLVAGVIVAALLRHSPELRRAMSAGEDVL